ncbi:uncharacterized protein SPPG_01738 [Spizellomyces punctatus DAOM BR117]|uniref:Uncharacterized protein n=1 Tax=Spizellomyces punctatus (strain DAOM BR117) TaxID=645134 RepID=A0A0L0HNK1_SPIPD|nr:uncharacterized protein SPPG_01738 [Spizellomyces punctatus DAOM BR117]KND02652.1 hypothetical protein SPPG_01738 [Spizellomyces punctatus DAOM BR117]|eukprot:XP_016610691.1 hypothetical protein SPPG_01738 [Spizellomyces punctatus DAOM BR117]
MANAPSADQMVEALDRFYLEWANANNIDVNAALFCSPARRSITIDENEIIEPGARLLSIPLRAALSAWGPGHEEEAAFDMWLTTVQDRCDTRRQRVPLIEGFGAVQAVIMRLLFHLSLEMESRFAPWLATLRVFPVYREFPPDPRYLGLFIPNLTPDERTELRGTSLQVMADCNEEISEMYRLTKILVEDARQMIGGFSFRHYYSTNTITQPVRKEDPDFDPDGFTYDLFKRALWLVFRTGYHVNALKGKFQSVAAQFAQPSWSWENMGKPCHHLYLIPLFECLQPQADRATAFVKPTREEIVIPNPRRRSSASSDGTAKHAAPVLPDPTNEPYEPEYSVVTGVVINVHAANRLIQRQRLTIHGLNHVINTADMLKAYGTMDGSRFESFAIPSAIVDRSIRLHLGGPSAVEYSAKGKAPATFNQDLYALARQQLHYRGYWPEPQEEFQVTCRIMENPHLITCVVVALMSHEELEKWACKPCSFDYGWLKSQAETPGGMQYDRCCTIAEILGSIIFERLAAIPSNDNHDSAIMNRCQAMRTWDHKKLQREKLEQLRRAAEDVLDERDGRDGERTSQGRPPGASNGHSRPRAPSSNLSDSPRKRKRGQEGETLSGESRSAIPKDDSGASPPKTRKLNGGGDSPTTARTPVRSKRHARSCPSTPPSGGSSSSSSGSKKRGRSASDDETQSSSPEKRRKSASSLPLFDPFADFRRWWTYGKEMAVLFRWRERVALQHALSHLQRDATKAA